MKESIRTHSKSLTLLLAALGLSACGGDDLIGTPGISITDTTTTTEVVCEPLTSYPGVTLNSDIRAQIINHTTNPETLQAFGVSKSFIMGNSNSQVLYTGIGVEDNIYRGYRAEEIGQTDLPFPSFSNSSSLAISGNSSTMVHTDDTEQNIFIYNNLPDLTTSMQIGAGFDFINPVRDISLNNNGSLITFISVNNILGSNPNGFNQIFTLTTDGSNVLTQVSDFTAEYFSITNLQIIFSANGSTLFFHSNGDVLNDDSNIDGSEEIFSIDTNGTNLTQWTDLNKSGTLNSIKSDNSGSTIAFFLENELYTIDTAAAPTTATTFITAIASPEQYDLSADGSTIVYTKEQNSEALIFTNNPAGTNEVQQFTFGAIGASPVFALETSSDGSQLEFMTDFFCTIAEGAHVTQIYTLPL